MNNFRERMGKYNAGIGTISIISIVLVIFVFAMPQIFAFTIQHQNNLAVSEQTTQNQSTIPLADQFAMTFPVTVDPAHKIITENTQVNTYLANNHSLLGASVIDAGIFVWNIFKNIAVAISNAPLYQNLASVANIDNHFVTIKPGMRKEQVATAFGDALGWTNSEKKGLLILNEGSFAPGDYVVSSNMKPEDVKNLISDRFSQDILSHYGTSTQEIVPLDEALTIASIIQRETISTDGMRLLSGIIWNRLFANMNLQIDSTLQYAKANTTTTGSWWPDVLPQDKYIKSPFNTYLHVGLPPSPISSPSVAAILAALNPIKTPCLFYFNDKVGVFHCSTTYAQHIKLLKEYYGIL